MPDVGITIRTSVARYQDLVAAVDVVPAKPGYGITSASQTARRCCTRRAADFPSRTSSPPRCRICCAAVRSAATISSPDGGTTTSTRYCQPSPEAKPRTDGAAEAAHSIAKFLDR